MKATDNGADDMTTEEKKAKLGELLKTDTGRKTLTGTFQRLVEEIREKELLKKQEEPVPQ